MMGEMQRNKEKKNHVMKICIYDHNSRKRCAYPCESEDNMLRKQKRKKRIERDLGM